MINEKSNYTFRGAVADMRPHDLQEDTWELLKHGTREIIVVGNREQILDEYDRVNAGSI